MNHSRALFAFAALAVFIATIPANAERRTFWDLFRPDVKTFHCHNDCLRSPYAPGCRGIASRTFQLGRQPQYAQFCHYARSLNTGDKVPENETEIIEREESDDHKSDTTEQPTEVRVDTTELPAEGKADTTEQPKEEKADTTEQPAEVRADTTEEPKEEKAETTEQPKAEKKDESSSEEHKDAEEHHDE